MAKYDTQLGELQNILPSAKNILIALPANSDIDRFAAALTLFLSLKATGKEVSIVCDDTVRVLQAHLYGIDHVQKSLPATTGANFMITLGGVAVADSTVASGWKVPALQNLDWYGENGNLNLVFHVTPGQSFAPTSVVPHSQGSGFDLIFTIGSSDLNSLGTIYQQNQQAFSGVHVVNIGNQIENANFGTTNVVDSNAASVSEMVADILLGLTLPFDADIASNLLAGIFEATANLTSDRSNPDTFVAVANCLRVGGRKPGSAASNPVTPASPQTQPANGLDLSSLLPQQPVQQPVVEPAPMQMPTAPETFINPTVVQPTFTQPMAPEAPRGEAMVPDSEIEAEPDWLTPKVFKAGQG